eukprot:15466580-Alexandrium_andersonii.AAC.1
MTECRSRLAGTATGIAEVVSCLKPGFGVDASAGIADGRVLQRFPPLTPPRPFSSCLARGLSYRTCGSTHRDEL